MVCKYQKLVLLFAIISQVTTGVWVTISIAQDKTEGYSKFVNKDDYYYLNTGEKTSFLRKKSFYLIITEKGGIPLLELSEKIKRRFGPKIDLIKEHSLGKNIMVRIKEGEDPEDILPALLETDKSFYFISPILTNSKKGGEIAIIPNMVVSLNPDVKPDKVIAELQNYNLSLISKLPFTETEYEFKINEPVLDIGRIFELTRKVAALKHIKWAEPNLLISPEKQFTPRQPLPNNKLLLNNTIQP